MATDDERGETVGMATETVARGHDVRDASVRAIVWVGAGLLATIAVIQVVLYFQLHWLATFRRHEVPPPSPVASALPDAPPEPRLQTAPALDLRAVRAAEDAELESYGWVDRQAGIVHV